MAYAAASEEDSIRLESSSGGIFSLVASYVLSQGGVVFGAAFDSDLRVVHKRIDHEEGLAELRGSKYVQSEIGDAFKEAKVLLEQGIPVYFTGTPCQIQGLLKFLKKDYEHLLTQDIICHGVPAPYVFQKYVEYQSKAHNAKPTRILFRKKSAEAKPYLISIAFENGECYELAAGKDPYMKAFLRDYSLRPSCYNCRFKETKRASDLTLADFWGIEHAEPSFERMDGVSLVFVHSDKGKKVWEALRDRMKSLPTDIERAVHYNPSAIVSAKCPKRRARFIRSLSRFSFPEVVEKYCKPPLASRIKNKIKAFIKRIIGR